MNALAHELATRNARVDALQASDNKRRLSSAVESIVHISGVGRAGVGGGPGGLRVSGGDLFFGGWLLECLCLLRLR